MKTLACGELVPGCPRTFSAETEDEIITEAGEHAKEAHGMEPTADLVAAVRAHIRTDDAATASS